LKPAPIEFGAVIAVGLALTFVIPLARILELAVASLFGDSCPGASGPGVGGKSDNIVSYLVNLRLGGGAGLAISLHHSRNQTWTQTWENKQN
jgi:hypothetical protein